MATGRPSISPTPVTTPSAARYRSPRPESMWSASRAYSTHVPGSSSRSSRSRTVSLPRECWRSTRSGPPISRARLRRAFRSPTSGPQSWTSPPPVAVTGSSSHGEHPPLAGHTLQRVTTAVDEVDVGSVDEISHRARDKHLARTGEGGNPGADVHGDARQVVPAQLALTTVNAGPDLEPEVTGADRDRPGAVDRTSRSVEGGQEPVAGCVHLVTAVAAELAPDCCVVPVEEVVPAPVAFGGGAGGRIDDVREEHRLEHAVDRDWRLLSPPGQELLDGIERVILTAFGPVHVPVPAQREETRVPNLGRQVLAAFEGNDVIATAMHDEGRRVHRRQRASHIHLAVAAQDLAHHVRRGRGPLVASEKRRRLLIGRHVRDEEPNGLAGVPSRGDTVDEWVDNGRLDTRQVIGSLLHPGERAPRHERRHALRVRRREQDRERAPFRDPDERRPLAPCGVHEGADVV